MPDILSFISGQAEDGLLPFKAQSDAAETYSISLAEVEKIALENDLFPARYQRNRNMISTQQQLTFLKSNVAIVGCGGLGGYIIEELARLGVGHLIIVDPDVFEEHNLNRQLFSSPLLLGEKKVYAAEKRIAEINPVVRVQAIDTAFDEHNGVEILQGSNVAADALDSVSARIKLSRLCTSLEIPLVHGAIAGWYGNLTTQFPGEQTLETMYTKEQEQGIETKLGNPSFTPAVIASLQVAEIVKILLQTGDNVRNRLLSLDLYYMEVNFLPIEHAKDQASGS